MKLEVDDDSIGYYVGVLGQCFNSLHFEVAIRDLVPLAECNERWKITNQSSYCDYCDWRWMAGHCCSASGRGTPRSRKSDQYSGYYSGDTQLFRVK